MHYFQADVLFPISSEPILNGILAIDEKGTIQEVIDPALHSNLPENVRKFEGFLTPGFVNTHCHLELSHLKERFEQKKGLVSFIDQMRQNRGGEGVLEALEKADREMQDNGTVAVGDISNNELSIATKKNSSIFYHTFVEIFDVVPGRAEKAFNAGVELLLNFTDAKLSASLAPHAPYTVTPELFSLLSKYYFQHSSISTIHNQETPDEDSMFHTQTGGMYDFLFGLNNAIAERKHQNESSLAYTLDHLHQFEKLLLVHNTFTKREQLLDALDYSNDLYWCFCPNANLYIEDRLPSVEEFIKAGCVITIGTDSYASNHSLSVLEELKTISQHFPSLDLNEQLKWATLNGAQFLNKADSLGTFEKGKTPGVVWIQNVNINTRTLTTASTSKAINVINK